MLEIAQPKVERELTGLNYGRFTIEPLEPGYGTTLGNALRRILLRSLPGVAVTRVRISDVWHEFSSLPNVKEDVTELVLNLKRIHLREVTELRGETRARLYIRGEHAVTAGDIQWPAEVECVNPEQHLATLDNDEATLEMDLVIERGRGYRPAEAQESLTIGEIPLDAIFTPIVKVNYLTEHTRVGHQTDYDKLTIEIVTNGTVDPGEALAQAAQILVEYGQVIASFGREDGRAPGVLGPYVTPEAEATPLADLGLSPRVVNALRSRGIERVGQVLLMAPEDLLAIRNFGPRSLKELWDKLRERDFLPEELDTAIPDTFDEEEPLSLLQADAGAVSSYASGEGELIGLEDEDDDEE
ncbi:MAG: DNA-directed RNA polymerase subunit alpha [Chloroflexota bacterium]|nr:DNA-directed RNA polymerase subunit alpha [Chloroflexota bacterium]